MRALFPCLLLLVLFLLSGVDHPAASQGEGWLAASRRTERQADIWVMPASGGAWQGLTSTPDDERWPSWHPDGRTLAYAARRERNWDIYALDLRTGEERRLTTNPHFEGWPAWSPDGTRLAFTSAREGELDIFVLDLESGEETNLTLASAAQDFEPRWEDDDTLLFVCTRDDSHDIFRIDLRSGEAMPLLTTKERHERQPMPFPDGASSAGMLVVAREERYTHLAPLDAGDGEGDSVLSWAGAVTSAALSPGGDTVVWLERRLDGDVLYRRSVEGGETRILNGPTPRVDDLAWGLPDETLLRRRVQPDEPTTLPPPLGSSAGGLVRVSNLDVIQPRLNGSVLPSFEAMRGRVAGEVGFDFLGEMSEALRPLDFYSENSDYLSWHKAGRAVDTLLDLGWRGYYQLLEVVREDWHGDVYWRMWLRCPVQDGTCGEPLVEAAWDLSQYARWERAPGEGGAPKAFQAGYYVDFTRIAEDEGWMRISSYESPTFDWRTDSVALEYWHYQRDDGLSWYEAMQEVYSQDDLNLYFGWADLMEQDIPLWQLRVKGLPLAPEVRTPPAELVVP
jgi:TolB protein